MINKNILLKIEEANLEIRKAKEAIEKYENVVCELSEELCENIKQEDLRPMEKKDIVIGRRYFGKNEDGFYTLVIEEILENGSVDFKAFVSEGCRYGIYNHYVLKESIQQEVISMEALKPCNKCGNKPRRIYSDDILIEQYKRAYAYECPECSKTADYSEMVDGAQKNWNESVSTVESKS
ncbi:hypothetical protein [Rhodopseudomonas parapalustris]